MKLFIKENLKPIRMKTEPNDTFCPSMGNGITLRQYYAGLALQGLLAKAYFHVDGYDDPERHSELAVNYADALINALNQTEE